MGSGLMRLVLLGTGLLMMAVTMKYYIGKKIYEEWAIVWILVSLLEILLGVLLPGRVFSRLSPLMIALPLAELILFMLSARLSVERRENQELAMQVSLLNQENEMILYRLKKLEGSHEENDTLCHKHPGEGGSRKGTS